MRIASILSSIAIAVVLCGCTTTPCNCSCAEGCKCVRQEVPTPCKADNTPIVSPDKIQDTKQDNAAPQLPDMKPWFEAE